MNFRVISPKEPTAWIKEIGMFRIPDIDRKEATQKNATQLPVCIQEKFKHALPHYHVRV